MELRDSHPAAHRDCVDGQLLSSLMGTPDRTTSTATLQSSLVSGPAKPKRTRTFRDKANRSSAYVKKSRLSRYNNAFHSFAPVRFASASGAELPIDSVGCLSNSTFSWVRRFFARAKMEDDHSVPAGLYSDGAAVNGTRLAGKFKNELQGHGSEKASMFRIVLRFCRTRLVISILIHVLAVTLELLGPTLFLRLFLSTIPHQEAIPEEDELSDNSPLMAPEQLKVYSLIGFSGCLFLSTYLKSMTAWINLRTAIRLRNGILGATFKKSLKSRISNGIAVHQLMSFADSDGEKVLSLVEKSALVPGIFIGITLASIASIILLGFPGIWPLFVLYPILLIVIVVAKISSKYLISSAHYCARKLTIVEELCSNFRNISMLDFGMNFRKEFQFNMEMENRKLSFSEVFSTRFSGHLTSALLMGGLYLNWCDVGIRTDAIEVLVLIVLFSYLVKNYVVQFCDGVQAITDASEYLAKAKETLLLDSTEHSKSKPRHEFYVAADNAVFSWPREEGSVVESSVHVEQFYVQKGHIVGLVGQTGSGKTTFVQSLLGQTQHNRGDLRLRGKIEYYPEEPFLLNGTVKENIVMFSAFDGVRYYYAINETRLTEDILIAPEIEDLNIMQLDLEPQQIQRVLLARALYSKSGAFVFDEPLRNIKKSPSLLDIFQNVMFKLAIQGKTVIIVSCCRPFLEICQNIHLLENGRVIGDIGTRGTYSSFVEMPEYDDILAHEEALEDSGGYQERIEGASLSGLAVQKKASSRYSFQEPEQFRPRWTPMSYLRILTITVFLFVTNLGFFGLPFAFIQFHAHKVPWLSYICIAILFSSALLDVIIKALYSTACEIRSNKYQIALFDKLLRTSLNYLHTTSLSDITGKFMVDLTEDAANFVIALNSFIGVLFSVAILCWANYWLGIVMGVLILALVFIYLQFRQVMEYFIQCEEKAKRLIFRIGTNLIRGRAVIQSMTGEHTQMLDFLKRLYSAIEDNTTAIYIQRAFIHHASFLIQTVLDLAFISTSAVLATTSGLNDSQNSIFFFTMGILGYFLLSLHAQRLIEALLLLERYKFKSQRMHRNLASIPKMDLQSISKKQIISIYRGMPVELQDIDVKVGVRSLLRMQQVLAQPGEKVVVLGEGANFITSLLSRVITLSRGKVLLGQLPIEAYSDCNILFGFIPHDPIISSATIARFLDPEDANSKNVAQALKSSRMWEYITRLPKNHYEPVANLPRFRRQQLCLARCFMKRVQIEKLVIVIEYPHPELVRTLRLCLNNELANNTVFILAAHDTQIVKADEVFETDEPRRHTMSFIR